MLRVLLIGAGTGYATKLVQVICTVLLLPFLLSDGQLGLAAFGYFSTLQAIIAVLALTFDGWRQSTAKTTGNRVSAGGVSSRELGAMIGWSAAGVLVLAMLAMLARWKIFSIGGLGIVDNIEVIFFLLLAQVVIEQVLFPAEALLHATGNTWKINVTIAAEVVVRTTAIFAWFYTGVASLTVYAAIIFASAVARMLLFFVMSCGVLVPFSSVDKVASSKGGRATFRYSLALLGGSVAEYLVFRMPVVVASRLVGAEAAAILAVLLNSVPNYLRQLTLSVLRPMIIPLGARVDLSALSPVQQVKLDALLSTHQFVACLVCVAAGATSWIWLDLWLGQDFASYSSHMNVLIIAIGLQIASAFQMQLLVAQGWGRALAVGSIALAAVTFVIMVVVVRQGPGLLLVLVAMHCTVLNGIVVKELFIRMKLSKGVADSSRTGNMALVIACVCAAVIGYAMPATDGSERLWLKSGIAISEVVIVTLVCLRYVAPYYVIRDAYRAITSAARVRS